MHKYYRFLDNICDYEYEAYVYVYTRHKTHYTHAEHQLRHAERRDSTNLL